MSGASALTLAVLAILHGAPARAADAAVEDTGALTEIVVTAEKRSENLEVVPASISAFTSKMLDQQGIASVQDLTNYAPGLYYTTYDNRPYIRGIGRNTDNLAVESGVAVYVDGIYNGANASTILQSSSLFVDEIQVLRGPQSTLFGRNADGGTIDYISKRPTSDFQGEVRTGYDNYHKAFVEGAVSGPISDSVRYRFGANYTNQNGKGFYTNLNGVDEGGDVAQGGNGTSYHIEGQLEGNVGSAFDWWTKLATSDYDVSYHTETLIGPLDTREFPVPLFPNANFGTCATARRRRRPGLRRQPGHHRQRPYRQKHHRRKSQRARDRHIRLGLPVAVQATEQLDLCHASDLPCRWLRREIPGRLAEVQLRPHCAVDQQPGRLQRNPGIHPAGTCRDYAALRPFLWCYQFAGCTQNLVVNSAHNNFTFDEYEQFFSNELNIASTGQGPLQWIGGLYQFHEKYTQPINVNSPDQAQIATPYSFGTLMAD